MCLHWTLLALVYQMETILTTTFSFFTLLQILINHRYVSLGAWERFDVGTVVKYLRDTNRYADCNYARRILLMSDRCSTIGLWGRSMGSVTAILYSIEDPSIASMLLDSPFCSLQKAWYLILD